MFGLFKNQARENATKCLRLMVHFRQVQQGITLEALDNLASEWGITIGRGEESEWKSDIPAFPSLIILAHLDYPTTDVSSIQFVGLGPMRGLFINMGNSVHVIVSADTTNKYTTWLAYKTAKQLRKAADNRTPTPNGGFSFCGEFGLDELAASGKESI